jgi:hypothetical protein
MDPQDECRLMHALRAEPELLRLAGEAHEGELALQSRLRKQFPDELVRMAVTLVELRRKAAVKFSRADRMWFDRQGLEQATSEAVAEHKAQRFTGRVWDLCCGCGGDTLALAAHCDVRAVDQNPAACLRTQWNAEAYERAERVETRVADVARIDTGAELLHFDPDRRGGHGRALRLEDYTPGLEFLQSVTRERRGGAIKLSPASNFGGKFPGTEIELVSLHGECKEATVWFGALAGEVPWRATVLPGPHTLAGHPLDSLAPQSDVQPYVYDPDPAVVRSGLLDMAAEQLGLSRLDDREEYLTGSARIVSPFVQGFEVLAEMPNNLRDLQRHFAGGAYGQVEVKCRRIPVDAGAVRRKLPLEGTQPATVLFARVQGKARILVCRRLNVGQVFNLSETRTG